MTIDEAIELINSDVVNYKRLTEARKIATEALEKQMPKKPTEKRDFHEIQFYCPNCNTWLYNGTLDKYCHNCGLGIDWSKE